MARPIFRCNNADSKTLNELRITNVSQLYSIKSNGCLSMEFNEHVSQQVSQHVFLLTKLKHLQHRLNTHFSNFLKYDNLQASPHSTLRSLFDKGQNISCEFRKIQQQALTDKYNVAPAYHTRVRDGVQTLPQHEFDSVFHFIKKSTSLIKNKGKCICGC